MKHFLPKKLRRELFAIFSREISTKENWRDICTSKSVKRNLYQKMFKKTFPTKSLKKHLQQRIWEEKSLVKNLKQESTESLKRNLYQNNPPETSPKFLSSMWEFFFGILYRKNLRGFSIKLYSSKKSTKNLTRNCHRKIFEDVYSKNLPRKNFEDKFLQKLLHTKINPTKTSEPEKTEKESLQKYPLNPEDKSLPKNALKRNLYETVSQDKFIPKKALQTWQKTLSTQINPKKFFTEKMKQKSTQRSSYQRGLYQKKSGERGFFLNMICAIKLFIKVFKSYPNLRFEDWKKLHCEHENLSLQSKFHPSFDKTLIDTIKVSSKFRWNFDWFSQSFIKTLIPLVKV